MDRFDLFATPVFVSHLAGEPGVAAVDADVTAKLIAESEANPGLVRSNSGGWHSVPDLAQRTDPGFRAVADRIVQHVHRVITGLVKKPVQLALSAHGWAMVMRDGAYTNVHDHAEAHWSTVYYLDAGDADLTRWPESGSLTIVDPRRAALRTPGIEPGQSFSIRPQSGMLVVFPGSAQHYVHAYRGTRPRVSVSFNVVARPA